MCRMLFFFVSVLVIAGCFFGCESDSPTTITKENTQVKDSLPQAKKITPGLYVGAYDWIDTARQGLSSEFLLDANGSYRFFYVFSDNAFYDQNGNWFQKDSAFYFSGTKDCNVSNDGVFYTLAPVENDTNAILNVTDTSFQRREYTPFRQKPYWITYTRRNSTRVKEGSYFMKRATVVDSVPDTVQFVIDLSNTDFTYSVTQSKVLSYQASAKYHQVGTFLIAEENRYRQIDSLKTLGAWSPLDGYSIQRLKTVSDTSFEMMSSVFGFEPGTWDPYSKVAAQ